MADPTLKDVLKAIAEIRGELTKLDTKVDAHQDETGARFDTVEKRFDKVDKSIADIDRDLTKHMNVHAEIEKDIEALKRRPARTAARAPRRPRTR